MKEIRGVKRLVFSNFVVSFCEKSRRIIKQAMSYIFSVTSCFTVAKVVRDKHESEHFINKVESAKTEKFLNENTSVKGAL